MKPQRTVSASLSMFCWWQWWQWWQPVLCCTSVEVAEVLLPQPHVGDNVAVGGNGDPGNVGNNVAVGSNSVSGKLAVTVAAGTSSGSEVAGNPDQGTSTGAPVKAWCTSRETGCSDPMSYERATGNYPFLGHRWVWYRRPTGERSSLYDTGLAGPRNQGRAHRLLAGSWH